ncbi:MAG TPA: hypothetical protein VNZ43_01185 [Sphingomonadaceae bacterium]|nr:hypothetical protein [Sphingomonadaceae bacterium]
MAFQKPLKFGLRAEFTACKGFQPLPDDRGNRLFADKDCAPSRDTLIAISNRRIENPEAAEHPRPHTVLGLLPVLLALVLRNGGQQVFDKDTVGILTKLDRWRLQNAASMGDFRSQFEVRFNPPCEAADIVNDDDHCLFLVLFEIGEHVQHAWATCRRPRHIVGEDTDDL